MPQKLELTWYNKDTPIKVEPRLLIEDPAKSNTTLDPNTQNMLVHGDNLLALKALEHTYTAKIKCIYIDPPYNTGSAFEHYDDNLEHSTWLSLMKPRLEILRNLLSEDGSIYVQIDDEEQAYLKVLMDEVFGRKNFVQMISIKRASPAGFKVINPGPLTVTEYVLLYAKNKNDFCYIPQRIPVEYDSNYDLFIENIDDAPEKWVLKKLTDILYERWGISTWQEAKKKFGESWKIIRDSALGELAIEYQNSTVSVRDPHKPSELIKKTMELSKEQNNKVFIIPREKYNPIYIYNGGSLSFYKDKLRKIDGVLTPTELLTDFWSDINYAGIAKEGDVQFKNSKKPEMLIRRILDLATNPGDLVLDSFLGSGTTAAVAHKMGRHYIGIEMGKHAYTHCKVRLDKIIKGEDAGGITKSVDFKGGGSYRFYELANTLINKDSFDQHIINPEYNPQMLAAAVALHEGFTYQPDTTLFWKQSVASDKSYLFVTTRHINAAFFQAITSTMAQDEYLVIACRSFDSNLHNDHISLKKIPQMLLSKCEFNKENYNLNIVHPPVYQDESEDE